MTGLKQTHYSEGDRKFSVCSSLLKRVVIGDGDRKRAISSIGADPMIWDNFTTYRTNCALPAAHARTCREDFRRCRAREMASEIPQIFYAFGPQLNAFNKLSNNKLSDNNLASELVKNRSFLNQSQSRKL